MQIPVFKQLTCIVLSVNLFLDLNFGFENYPIDTNSQGHHPYLLFQI